MEKWRENLTDYPWKAFKKSIACWKALRFTWRTRRLSMYGHEFSYGKPRSPRMNSGAYCHPRNEVTSSRTATCTRHSHLPLTRGSFKSRKANATAPSPLLYPGLLWGVHRVNANIKKPFLRCFLTFAVLWAIKNCMQFYNFHFPLWPGNAGSCKLT